MIIEYNKQCCRCFNESFLYDVYWTRYEFTFDESYAAINEINRLKELGVLK